ncbi:M23 family metallopeptidase [Salipaludibacillus aurantiacus]|uniref:Stage IV sporulation protein FA n=1 Tax=Salipaludibacillus aurantiacus TaxID=1601833 RepID=A0A1H9T622_9BACI|nr:M23 family metallopeptidase [Salipaludibacillus aurantiacus]SER92695.1 stage IV sporulation protein FA [Salipaludibacillus aurantiacus]
MNHKVTKLKRKMEAKRRQRNIRKVTEQTGERLRGDGPTYWGMKHDEEREDTFYPIEAGKGLPQDKSSPEPFFRKDTFMMQILASICLFLIVAIILQSNSPALEGPRNYIYTSFQEEFQFDRAAAWYEDLFGRPLALLPDQMETVAPGNMKDNLEDNYALPATGTVKETFDQNGRGIFVETEAGELIEAVRSGVVRYIGEDEENDWGKIVIVRHYDGGESWYGMLDEIHVSLYDHVDSGEKLARVSSIKDESEVGVYYFALKEGDVFIDPVEVISLD